jgi:hypothetical protein
MVFEKKMVSRVDYATKHDEAATPPALKTKGNLVTTRVSSRVVRIVSYGAMTKPRLLVRPMLLG